MGLVPPQTSTKKGSESCPRCGFDSNTTLRLTDNPSPFRDLISVNGVASAKDASLINDYLQKVHGEIQRLEIILQEAQEEKIRLQSIADSHAVLISSFRKFPPEVLATIFQHTIVIRPPPDEIPWLPGDMALIYAALCTLGSVCRHWRETVLSTPSLWAQFCIELPWFGRSESRLPLLKTMLARSREADLSIGCSLMEYGSGKQNIRALLECLVPTSYRWKHASIEFDEETVVIYEQIRGRLPLLERLELSSENPSEVFWENFRAFEDAPRLRELALGEGLSPVNKFALPWSQIISLHINHQIEPDDLYVVFSITPNLQFLRMSEQNEDGSGSAWEPEEPDDFIVCSTLRQLDVADPALFRTATLPSLEEVSANLHHDAEEDNKYGEDFFYDFLHRSQCPMRKLTVRLSKNFVSFERIFDQAFRLTCLDVTLHTVDSTGILFNVLASTKILPQLQSLKVVCIALEAYSEYGDADLGEGVAELFISRYLTFAADMLSVHVEVILGGRMIANPPQYVRAPDGPFLSEQFWTSFEDYLRDTQDLRSRIVTEKKERRKSLVL